MKTFVLYIFLLSVFPALFAQSIPDDVENALKQAGNNRPELEKVLRHYSHDNEKFAAACYLIKNMPWHSCGGRVEFYDPRMDDFFRHADSLYYRAVRRKPNDSLITSRFLQQVEVFAKPLRDSLLSAPFLPPEVVAEQMPDIRHIDGDFLRKHIDNAFDVRNRYACTRNVSFEDFCNYVLPYRSISDYPLVENGRDLQRFFGRYMDEEKTVFGADAVKRYNRTVNHLRSLGGNYPFETNVGLHELHFRGFHDCIDIAHYGASVLRSCGIPAAVEFTVAYKMWQATHYHVAIPDSGGRWMTFNPESTPPRYRDRKFSLEALNVYRIYFSPRDDAPFWLKGNGEFVPSNLSSPCIRDVTSGIMSVVQPVLPFAPSVNNKLAYLAAFQSKTGLVAVTWGKIDHGKKEVRFTDVVPDNLYFPVYYEPNGQMQSFGEPFWITADSLAENGCRLTGFGGDAGETVSVDLLRKFPRKPGLRKLAEQLRGVVITASDDGGFLQADTLFRLSYTPEPYWQEVDLQNSRPYRFYRIQNRPDYPYLHIAEIEFVTRPDYGYSNTTEAVPLPVFSASQPAAETANLVRLLDEPLEKCRQKPEYDGNVQTAPDPWPSVTLRLKEPQVVTHVRFVPKHADNGIVPGDTYRLSMWENGRWTPVFTRKAQRHFLPAENMSPRKLYWLSNLSRGKEELPFFVNENGKQHFIHEELLEMLRL